MRCLVCVDAQAGMGFSFYQILKTCFLVSKPISCADPKGVGGGGRGSGIPLKIHNNIGFLSNTGYDPLKNHEATNPPFNVRPSSK